MDWKIVAIAVPGLWLLLTVTLWLCTFSPWFDPDEVFWPGVAVGYVIAAYAGVRMGVINEH